MTTRLTMPQTLVHRAPYGSLLKGPKVERIKSRKPIGERDEAYLTLIRQLPCLRCGLDPCCEAAHISMSSAAQGKTAALGRKAPDRFVVSLCAACHTRDPDSQHRVGESVFWARLGINPLLVCQALQQVAGDVLRMRAVVFGFIAARTFAE